MKHVVRFTRNEKGRDFVVGDIHGCFTRLETFANAIGFDAKADRLFSVGDLVDRGPESYRALEFLDWPHCFAVRGNHEAMTRRDVMAKDVHISNGGKWFYALDSTQQDTFRRVFAELPFAIEIETARGLVGLVHAECPLNDWSAFVRQLPDDGHLQDMALWARVRVRGINPVKIANVELVLSGHTPLKDVKVVENSMFIDTGACFKDGFFTIVDITNDIVYQEGKQ